MRRLGRLMLWTTGVLALAFMVVLAYALWGRLSRLTASGADERPLVFFSAGERAPPRFNITGHSGWAVLYPVAVADPAETSPAYRLHVRVLDLQGRVLMEHRRHVRHRPDFFEAAADGRTSTRPSRKARWSTPQWIDLGEHASAARLEVNVLPAVNGGTVPNIHWRAFLMQALDDEAARQRYRQLKRRERERLTDGFLGPGGLLPEQVRLDMIRRKMTPAPSVGSAPEQHREIILYMRRDRTQPVEPQAGPALLPGGWPIAPGLPITVSLPTRTDVDLIAVDLFGKPISVEIASMVDGRPVVVSQAASPSARQALDLSLASGVHELRSARPGLLLLRTHAEGRSLIPDTLRIPVFHLAAGAPLDFRVQTTGEGPVRLRVDMRPLGAAARVRMRGISDQGDVLQETTQDLTARAASHERLADDLTHPAPEAAIQILALPASTTRLRMESDAPVLVTVYAESVRQSAEGPRWFSYAPLGHVATRGRFVLRQPRFPPRDAASDPAGHPRRIETLAPLGLAASRLVLLPDPRASGDDTPGPGLPGTLRSLRQQEVIVRTRRGDAPRLVWSGPRERVGTVVLRLDGQRLALPFAGRTGMIDLPPIPPGSHRLAVIDDAGMHWRVSHAAAPDWRLRRLWSLSPRAPLHFALKAPRVGETLYIQAFGGHQQAPALTARFETAQGHAVVAARPRNKPDSIDKVWPLWSDAPPWPGPGYWAVDVPDSLAGTALLRFTLRCDGCQPLHLLVQRSSSAAPTRTIHAEVVDASSTQEDPS